MMASFLIALLVGLAVALFVAVVGALLAPRSDLEGFEAPPAQPYQPWAAARSATEDLRNCRSPETPPSGDVRMAARRGCTAASPFARGGYVR